MTNLAQIFIGLLLYAYVGIHQVGRLVFDNYQRCTFALIWRRRSRVFANNTQTPIQVLPNTNLLHSEHHKVASTGALGNTSLITLFSETSETAPGFVKLVLTVSYVVYENY